jgi:hypothetical protein
MKTLASRTGIEEKILEEEAEKIEGGAIFDKPAEPQRESDKKIPRRELLSRQVLAAASSVGKLNEVEPGHLAPGYEGILDILSKGETKCADPDKDSVLESILFQRDKISEEEFSALKEQLYGEYLRDTRQRITEEIKRAERTGDADALEAALRDLNGLPY